MHASFTYLSILIICGLLLSACGQSVSEQDTAPQLRSVRTHTVTPTFGNIWREFPGQVDAAQKADLSFRVSGKVNQLSVNEGEEVAADQLLAALDDTDFKIQLASREAEYNRVKKDFERAKQLVEKGVISRSEYNNFESQEAISKANLESARQNLVYTQLKAPFAGFIAKRHIESFEEVNAKQLVFTLQDLSYLTVKVDIPESVIIKSQRDGNVEVAALFDTIPDTPFPLKIKEVATQPDEATSTFEVTFSMSGTDAFNILPGMSVTVRVKPPEGAIAKSDSFFVPSHAVLEDETGRFVWIADPSDSGLGTIAKRSVETGVLTAEGIEISQGLQPDELVVVAGMSKMHDGLQVKLGKQ